jgi:hypothetical protein
MLREVFVAMRTLIATLIKMPKKFYIVQGVQPSKQSLRQVYEKNGAYPKKCVTHRRLRVYPQISYKNSSIIELERKIKQKHSWEITDAFWAIAEPLIPNKTRNPHIAYQKKTGGRGCRKTIAVRETGCYS